LLKETNPDTPMNLEYVGEIPLSKFSCSLWIRIFCHIFFDILRMSQNVALKIFEKNVSSASFRQFYNKTDGKILREIFLVDFKLG